MITLFTIGHSNHPLEKFIRLLEDNGIILSGKTFADFAPRSG